jgi:hypothetical protein
MGWYDGLTGGHEGVLAQLVHMSVVLPARLLGWAFRKVTATRQRKQGWTRAD